VDPSHASILAVDVADLRGQEVVNPLLPFLQPEEAVMGRLQFGLEFGEIGGMSEIACTHKGNPFLPGPVGKHLHVHIPARRPAVFGVDVKVGNETHRLNREMRSTNLEIRNDFKIFDGNVRILV
jgi:hypothetical protein